MVDYRDALDELRKFDFSTEDSDYIYQRLINLGRIGVIVTSLSRGKKIIRARLSEEASFTTISKLSFKPSQHNITYQRASTPRNTMFYGSIVPEVLGNTEPTTARIPIIFELSEFVRNDDTIGEQDITFSAWEVQDTIELISLVHHKRFVRPTELTRQLQEQFEHFVGEDQNLRNQSLAISEYLAYEFAKSEIPHHLHYMISAIFSEIICQRFDGVLYPSVRLAGEGINVAIKPQTVNDKLRSLGASECTVYKNKDKVFVGNNTQSSHDIHGNLTFHRVERENFVTKEMGRRLVGLNS